MRKALRRAERGAVAGLVLAAVLVVSAAGSSLASDQASVELPDHILLTTGGWPPFLVEDHYQQGFIAHLIRDVFAEHDIDVEFQFMPWARAYQHAAAGQAHGTAVWMDQAERHDDFLYSDPVLEETFVFFHRAGHDFDWNSFDDLRALIMGGVYGYSYGPAFDRAHADNIFSVDWVADEALNLQKLLRGRIDLYPQEINVGYANIQSTLSAEEAAQLTHHPRPIHSDYSFLLLTAALPESEPLLSLFNRTLADFREDGRYERYFERSAAGYYQP
ncbi:transporter substrate-binding domain-containing protein [Natronospirillum operosum]|uniref:Transporter substrate-binding domain-containing protein n=1 Tax=Natronospirillum operosum TaxID=2759953 RepID=A0A4Z0W564_9GAMM|nr:transporter substrate-binding domain-containing protein [Natronospirillum operosum]TGG90724.1 transporter substrate-binding domain-containing protein [Natronospirillum operosum]